MLEDDCSSDSLSILPNRSIATAMKQPSILSQYYGLLDSGYRAWVESLRHGQIAKRAPKKDHAFVWVGSTEFVVMLTRATATSDYLCCTNLEGGSLTRGVDRAIAKPEPLPYAVLNSTNATQSMRQRHRKSVPHQSLSFQICYDPADDYRFVAFSIASRMANPVAFRCVEGHPRIRPHIDRDAAIADSTLHQLEIAIASAPVQSRVQSSRDRGCGF